VSEGLLQAVDLKAGFGSNTVLHGVSYTVQSGEIAGIFGLNGAGKSVSMKVVAGVVPAWSGTVLFDGTDITRMTPEERVRRGQLAGTMSGGEQASLAVARALMSEPKLLLIDEPSAGLAPRIVEDLFETLREVNRTGVTLLLVEQNVTFGLKLVDSAHIMQRGRIVYEGAVANLDRDRVAEYLGIGRLLKPGATASLAREAASDAAPTSATPKRRSRSAKTATTTAQPTK